LLVLAQVVFQTLTLMQHLVVVELGAIALTLVLLAVVGTPKTL
jgi:hypothetical protein